MDTNLEPITTVPFRLTEAFYARRSYTHNFDDWVGWDFYIQQTNPDGGHVIRSYDKNVTIQVLADEIQLAPQT